MTDLKIEIDLNVLNHLGIGLYSNTPAVLTEIVANSWDADSQKVKVVINSDKDEIVIFDDGHGMDEQDVQNKFLTVGYARRRHGEALTPKGRQCMGRKGIGKLAMFSLADEIEVHTKKSECEPCAFKVDVTALKEKVALNEEYSPEVIDYSFEESTTGTKIVLRKLSKRVNRTKSYLKRRLARRFSVIGQGFGFSIEIDGDEVKLSDRCSGSITPDTQIGGNLTIKEVFNDKKTTSIIHSRVQA